MVHILIRMKLTVLRHSLTGTRRSLFVLGVSLGLLAAGLTVWVSLLHVENPASSGDLLALALSIWALGWALGPTLMGGEDTTLRPEHFRLFPLSTRRLAIGLGAAALVGAPAAVSLLAFSSLIVYAVPFGIVPAL